MEFGAGLLGGKFTFVKNTDAGRIGLTYFMTDALGAFSGTEGFSTGLYRPVRQFENRKAANIFQKLGIGSGQATGFQAHYSGNGVTATVGQYTPTFTNSAETGSDFKTFARVSYEMNLGGFNVALGAYNISGDVSDALYVAALSAADDEINPDALDLESTGLDFQIEGNIAGKSLMVTGGYVLANTHGTTDMSGLSTAAQINIIDTVGVKAAFLMTTDNNTDGTDGQTSISVGTDYMVAQNIRLRLEYSTTSYEASAVEDGSDILFMTMIAF